MNVFSVFKSSPSAEEDTEVADTTYYVVFSECVKDSVFWTVGAFAFTVLMICLYRWRKWHVESLEKIAAKALWMSGYENTPYRFRKRDKVMFYGRRMLRKMKSLSDQAYSGQGRKRRAVMRFAKRILQMQKDNMPMQLKVLEPPAEFLEESHEGSLGMPPDVLYMLQSIRIFGHFEKPVFFRLCKFTEVISLQSGEYLFKIGDTDDSVYVVQTGSVNVSINNADGTTMSLKIIRKGESVTSLLSFIDVLAGSPSIYKTVTARAMEPTQVIRLPMYAFKDVFSESPDLLVRVVQVIMVRLERVTFTALRNYLGLHAELVYHAPKASKKPEKMKNSPGHRRTNSTYLEEVMALYGHSGDRPDMLADLATTECATGSCARKLSSTKMCDEKSIHYVYALDSFTRELGLPDEDKHLLEGAMEVREYQPGDTIIREGDNTDDVSLLFLLSGSLQVYQFRYTYSNNGNIKQENTEVHVLSIHPGEFDGGLAVITGEASLYTIRAKHFSRVAMLSRSTVYNIMRERPTIVLDIANMVVRKLSPLVRQCDFALDWMFLESGRAVFRQDEQSDSTYIVLSGRVRSVATHANGKKEIVGEYGKGDLVGLVEMITDTTRTTTAMAVRDSELAKLPQGLFNAIKLRHPMVVTQLFGLLSHRLLGSVQGRHSSRMAPQTVEPTHIKHKYSTVAIVPVNEDVPLSAFTYELYHSLCAIGPTLRLTSDVVRKTLGANILDSANEYRLTSWLAQQEDRNMIALYQCDNIVSPWTQRCWRQADVILIVGVGDHGPGVGSMEREIDRLMLRTQKELVILHPDNSTTKPTNTVQWLNMRSWVMKHHHIQCKKRMFTRKSQYRINELYSKVLLTEPNLHSDFSRLARWLTGNSVGLVLGGGGARGAAHVGMLKAIQEAGIPIDMVGGVSIGAFMGALWCSEKNITTVTQKAREWSKKMTQWGRQLLDLTYPITSMFSGRDFNKTIRDTFGEIYIEDLWIPYFTLTTDITASCARVHTHGCLWRYCRASMSVAGIYPPFCDYTDGHLLLDGCYVNNVPADVLRAQGAAHIIAIDVGSQDETNLTDYGDYLSGWWLIYKKFNPFTTPVKVPNLPDIQSRLAYVSCVRQLEEVKNSDYCEYIRPPIDQYKTLAFGQFDTIKDVGFAHGKQVFENMAKSGRISFFNQWSLKDGGVPKATPHSLNEYTFTDLAQIVCRVPETYTENQYSSTDEDVYFDGYISEPSSLYPMGQPLKLKRTGGSLSLSENEMDSDELEVPTLLQLSGKTKERLESQEFEKKKATEENPQIPTNSTTSQ
ncbi:neuropathy target esterase sws isoform X1 [Lutzomyia longipalpis]|uniref:neuropathy target esterase sws isoform X1 n=1 Tax=Lutzomyia longipalpis TaxID=7200 RepID=UPI0024835644|nr:neuropathy target esterase sws isoform X1 [Lutzomyia longipalpis]